MKLCILAKIISVKEILANALEYFVIKKGKRNERI